MIRKSLTVVVILLFIGILVSSSANKMVLDSNNPGYSKDVKCDDFTLFINGTIGENGWYVSEVIITFVWDPEVIAEIFVSLDGSTYYLYTTPINIDDDGIYEFWFYLVDIEGNVCDPFGPYEIKIDQMPPNTNGIYCDIIDVDKYQLIVEADDDTSGVAKCDFYVNDELYGEVFDDPFEIIYTGLLPLKAQAVVFDNAGNTAVTMPSERPLTHICLFGIIHNVEILEGYMVLQGTGLFFWSRFPFFALERNFLKAYPLDFEGYMGDKFILARFTY